MRLLALALAMLASGCTAGRMEAFADMANARQWQTCGEISGAYGLFASARFVIATGGATLEQCRALR